MIRRKIDSIFHFHIDIKDVTTVIRIIEGNSERLDWSHKLPRRKWGRESFVTTEVFRKWKDILL